MTVAGESSSDIDITSFTMTSMNQAEDRVVIGKLNPARYPFGRHMIEGEIQLDMPDHGLVHMGSMLNNNSFSIVGTFFNSATDYITVDMPNCKRNNFSVNQSNGEETNTMTIPYKAFESADGLTSPLTMNVFTTGLGTVFDVA